MTRIAAPLLAVALVASCAPEEPPVDGIQTRVFVDRSDARVGDLVGVTIEIETPANFAIEPPSAPAAGPGFVTQSVEALAPVETSRGLRHRVLWTLRARAVGDHSLPELQIPLVEPDGEIRPFPVGGLPLAVRSVRTELPERAVFFDIRDPPPTDPGRGPLYIGAGVIAVAALLAALVVRHRRELAANAGPDPIALARRILAELDSARQEPEVRPLAARAQAALWHFVEARWNVLAAAATPAELPERVDPVVAEALGELECARFTRVPERARVLVSAGRARGFLRAFVGDVVER